MAENKTNPFKIDIAPNPVMGGYDLILQVGGLKDKAQAEKFGEILAEWMIDTGGWKQRVS